MIRPYSAVDYLDTPETILAYIEAAYDDGDADVIAAAYRMAKAAIERLISKGESQ